MILKDHIVQGYKNPRYNVFAINISDQYLEKSWERISVWTLSNNMRGIGQVGINGGGKEPGATGRPWSHATGGERVDNVTSGH